MEAPLAVLLIEDNLAAADNLAALIRHWGYEVCVASDAATGIRLAQQNPPDVVLMDIGLPDLDGVEAAQRLRDALPDNEMTIVAVSGLTAEEQRCFAAGFHYHFRKPVHLESLQTLLETLATGETPPALPEPVSSRVGVSQRG
jgi:two-component system, sensor histidine kinase